MHLLKNSLFSRSTLTRVSNMSQSIQAGAIWYCVFEQQCRLYQFTIEDDEPATVQHGDAVAHFYFQGSTGFHYSIYCIHLCFTRLCEFYSMHNRQAIPFHYNCYRYAWNRVHQPYLHTTEHQYPASQNDIDLRRSFLEKTYRWLKLPVELSYAIMTLCLPVLSISHLARDSIDEPRDSYIDLLTPIYAQYTSVYGKVYLQWIGNRQAPGSKLRSDAKNIASKLPLCVDIGGDYLGIRCLRIIHAKNELGYRGKIASAGLRWKRINCERWLRVRYDVRLLLSFLLN